MNTKNYFMPILMIAVLLSACAPSRGQTPSIPTQSPTEIRATETPEATPTAIPLITNTSQPGIWTVVENWTPANRIRTMLIDRSGDLWAGGPAGVVHWDLKTDKPTIYAIRGEPESTNVISLSETSDGVLWAGTFGNGLARYDGTNWQALTVKDGLPGDYVVSQTTTSQGELWFTTQTSQHSGDQDWFNSSRVLHFNGTSWITEKGIAFDHLVTLPDDSIVSAYNESPIGTSFYSSIGIFDGQSWNDMGVYPGEWVDAITVDSYGVIWFATRTKIYRYENHTWKEIIPLWAGQDFPEVSSIAVSKEGVAWFGFSHRAAFETDNCGDRYDNYEEQGVYRYDGKTWTHFATEDGLVDNKICAITLDSEGNAWFGSFDKGVSRFDGQSWKTYVIP